MLSLCLLDRRDLHRGDRGHGQQPAAQPTYVRGQVGTVDRDNMGQHQQMPRADVHTAVSSASSASSATHGSRDTAWRSRSRMSAGAASSVSNARLLRISTTATVWTALVAGFGGLREYQGQLSFAPQLPDLITRLSFTVQWRGLRLEVDIEPGRATYGLRDRMDSTLAVRHHGEEITVAAGKP